MTEIEINKNELCSEAAMAYVVNLAQQKKEEHSFYDEEEDTDKFNEKYQQIFDEIYDILMNNEDHE